MNKGEGNVAGAKKKTSGKKVRYKYIFADHYHNPITDFSELDSWRSVLGLYAKIGPKWVPVGDGSLQRAGPPGLYCVNTDAVGLDKKFLKKGHGIHLYFALIRAAKEIGAKKIYSSRSLNHNSGPMWCNKLRKFFKVHGPKAKRRCSCKCRRCRTAWGRFYIDLTKISLKDIPR